MHRLRRFFPLGGDDGRHRPSENGSGLIKARQHFLLQLRSGLQQSSVPIALQQVSMSQRFRSVNSFATKVSSLLDKGAEHQCAPVAGADR